MYKVFRKVLRDYTCWNNHRIVWGFPTLTSMKLMQIGKTTALSVRVMASKLQIRYYLGSYFTATSLVHQAEPLWAFHVWKKIRWWKSWWRRWVHMQTMLCSAEKHQNGLSGSCRLAQESNPITACKTEALAYAQTSCKKAHTAMAMTYCNAMQMAMTRMRLVMPAMCSAEEGVLHTGSSQRCTQSGLAEADMHK